MPGAEQAFERLKADGVSVALNTGYPKDVQDRIVKMLNLDELVDDWISSEEVSYGRPSPNMLNELMLRFDTWPADVIKVGDTRNDMLEGLNAHCGEIVGVLTGEHDEKTLYGAGAHRVIDSIKVL
jgi:phosphoglycolate phosphatase-like HAD superfamily hydrolase